MQERDPYEMLAALGATGAAIPIAQTGAEPLRALTVEQFAALGDDEVVYRRTLSGAALKKILPNAGGAPDSQPFHVLFGAGGAPRFVTDSEAQIHEWLEQTGLGLVTRQ
ncbi:MAG TPA: DUF1150 family protein [Devosiaceae bacterium]|nr:DUF1150 family protein [Devosiaceae bacterium]